MVVGGVKSENSVCPRPLLQFLQFFSVFSVYVSQVMSGYLRLPQVTSVYVGEMGCGARQYTFMPM